jgi:ribosomal protein S18 acetylase RimI-like enzyme
MIIRPATEGDRARILEISRQLAEDGTTYYFDETTDAAQFWFGPDRELFVAEEDEVVGVYLLKANTPGRGSHVAYCGYAVDSAAQGRGIGKRMAEHSLEMARERGFIAMQFNLVVSTNERAVRAWKSLGFQIIGTLPKAFRHQSLGLVDAYVMHRFL